MAGSFWFHVLFLREIDVRRNRFIFCTSWIKCYYQFDRGDRVIISWLYETTRFTIVFTSQLLIFRGTIHFPFFFVTNSNHHYYVIQTQTGFSLLV